MKIDRYECDLCHRPIENGREYKVTIKFPIPDSIKNPSRIDRNARRSITYDLCKDCFVYEFEWVNQ